MMGSIERALRGASTRDTEYIFEPIMGMVFDSGQEAKEFYNMYSWEAGFGVKYNSNRPGSRNVAKQRENGEEPYLSMPEIVCHKSVINYNIWNFKIPVILHFFDLLIQVTTKFMCLYLS